MSEVASLVIAKRIVAWRHKHFDPLVKIATALDCQLEDVAERVDGEKGDLSV